MRLFIGEHGPIPGIQAFEVTGTRAVERNGEYDSEEQIIEPQVPEYTGAVELLDNERTDFYEALMGQGAADINDVDLDGFGQPPLALNVWNQRKTRFVKSVIVLRPTFTDHPFPTTLNAVTRMRFQFSSPRAVKSSKYALALDAFTGDGTTKVFNLSRSAVRLSFIFGGRFVIEVLSVLPPSPTLPPDYDSLNIVASTNNSVTVDQAPPNGNRTLIFYFYNSTAEPVGYQGGTS